MLHRCSETGHGGGGLCRPEASRERDEFDSSRLRRLRRHGGIAEHGRDFEGFGPPEREIDDGRIDLAIEGPEAQIIHIKLPNAHRIMARDDGADAELPEAQYDYGTMLIEGAGAVPDPVGGVKYIGLAAEAGLIDAQVDYATLLYMGQGVAKDLPAAASWYQRAAEAGSPVAQNRYAKLLAAGEGVTLNLEDAAMWRALARRQGLSDPALDRLLVSIPAESLTRAEERARFWPSELPDPSAASPAPTADPGLDGATLPTPTDPSEAPAATSTLPAQTPSAPDAPAQNP